ncbi:PREDICTED: opioid growth factor receptor [Chrysochloris asiatica]|uniref:Opioid growth factor receptor n=1 Tax=Chrysochloris asiatica TaxID=185453 RepID=A0A9B0WZ98_CHRAS|nr:PREDICTED: opioid growth factor receptor [Chrysochloris asiatica]
MDDPNCDSTWEEDEEDAEEDAECPKPGIDLDGDALGDVDEEDDDEDDDEEEPPRAVRPSALQLRPPTLPAVADDRQPAPLTLAFKPPNLLPLVFLARMLGSRNWRAMQDMRRYRHHYPLSGCPTSREALMRSHSPTSLALQDLIERDCNGDMPNLSFYKNEVRFLPNGCFIEEILQDWKDNYDLLEDNHSYIQWLFPLREPGVNWHAKPLTLKEVEAFKSCPEAMGRFLQAYELMLGFYGVELEDRDTGAVCRAQNYQKRFQNLNWHSHNNLRITRILKSLGELGLEQYQAPLARFFLEETLVRRQLPGVRQSALDYFVFAVRCRRQRRALLRFAWEHFRPRSKFVWAPLDKLQRLRPHEDDSPRRPLDKTNTQGRTCGPGGEEGDSSVSQEVGSPERDPGNAACLEQGLEPSSPKESKKRKLEVNREQARGERGPQSASEVEKIAQNLEGCALSQTSLRVATEDEGSQDPEEDEQPCPQPTEAKVADEVRKRRKVDEGVEERSATSDEAQTPTPTGPPTASEGPEDGRGFCKEPTGEEQGAPGSPTEDPVETTTGPPVDEGAVEAGPSAIPAEP